MSKNKKRLFRILASIVLFAVGSLISKDLAGGFLRLAVFLAAFAVAGYDVLWKAIRNIAHGQVFDENFLMSLATIGAFFVGEYPEGVAVMIFYQVGELFQSYAVSQSRKSISTLMDIRPDYANLIKEDGSIEVVDPEEISVGDMILIKPGEKIPLDGKIAEGESSLDTMALTGESLPREVLEGMDITSGCVNLTGTLKVKVAKEFGESTVAKILDLVENASTRKAKAENFITKFAKYYTPIVVIAAVLLAFVPPLFLNEPFQNWIYRALMFLVVSCPCALVISIPLGFFGGIGGASKRGILIKGSNYMETLENAEVIVFDKTGTLTKGNFAVTKLLPCKENNITEQELLEMAALAEGYSTHPISISICKAWEEMKNNGNIQEKAADPQTENQSVIAQQIGNQSVTQQMKNQPAIAQQTENQSVTQQMKNQPVIAQQVKEQPILKQPDNIEEIAGHGVRAEMDGHIILAGNSRLMERESIAFEVQQAAGTVVYLAADGRFAGSIIIEDEVKPDAKEAVKKLRRAGVKKQVMLTGDNKLIGEQVADRLGLDEVHAELLPADKVGWVERLFQEKSPKGSLVFAGDGINDAPVLARADVGIAMGGLGSDAAIEAADIVIMTDEPSKIAEAIEISKRTLRIVRENIIFALGVKGFVLALSAFGISTMWEAVFADVGVCVIAVLNAMRALRYKDKENGI